ncbi:hypothetical protein BHM03_00025658 [Ensete ventricosum]|nr:hypothetical protein BHM03_00025658 [Ensete ventricosum]
MHNTTYYLLPSLVEHSYINLKSLIFDYLDEKSVDTDLMMSLVSALPPFLGTWSLPLHSPLPRLLLGPTFSLHESKGSIPPRKSHLCGTMTLPSPWPYYPLSYISIPFFALSRSASANEEPMERHNLILASIGVHVLDLYPRKALCFRSMFLSSTSTPFMRLGYFTKFHPSCSASRFALS